MKSISRYTAHVLALTLLVGTLASCGAGAAPGAEATAAPAQAGQIAASPTVAMATTAPMNTTEPAQAPTATVELTPTVEPTQTAEPSPTSEPTLLPADTPVPATTSQPAASHAGAHGLTTQADIKLFVFRPDALELQSGTTVQWTNQDDIDHSVTSGTPSDPGQAFDSGLFGKGKSFSFTFTTPGEYPYFCRRHNSMVGMVRVVGN